MPLHRFTVGQEVQFTPGRFDGAAPGGTYTIIRLLPNDPADREYRARSTADGHERVLRESEIRLRLPLLQAMSGTEQVA
jgi:hypothetical protein